MKKIGVLGAGTWGMALARMICNSGHSVTVWSAIEKEIDEFSATRRHPNLPGMVIPDEIRFTKDLEQVCKDQDILLFAVPSPFVRSTARNAAPFIAEGQVIVDVAKGIEADTLFTMTQIIESELKDKGVKLVALSGPTHAEEVAKDLPTTIVSACEDEETARLVQEVFWGSCMRVYTNTDILGVELPIMTAVNAIVNQHADPKATVQMLMSREKKSEIDSQVDHLFMESMEEKGHKPMKRVITYGTYDLLHYGHLNLLRRAKEMGDYLIVGLSTDEFNWNEKQKKCYFSYEQRKEMLEALRYVDLVIPETCWDQKRTDIHQYHVDTFVIGDDWKGKFDFLAEEGAEVVYLARTPEISTTQIKKDLHK